MLDLETLGTRPGDTILSIGAVLFDETQGIYNTFSCTINSQSCKEAGLRAQKDTIEWWKKQPPAAQAAAFKGELMIETALDKFAKWLPEGCLVYGNGANFDNALLAAAYRAVKQPVPWPFWYDRCYRTISAMFMNQETTTERVGTYHNALDDAKTQAERLLKMAAHHKFNLV
jgi:DNA polymerase III epsilon subunit-like protein